MKPETVPLDGKAREVHALDIGTGSGILSVLAAKHGADSVVAVDILDSAVELARRMAAQNGVSSKVSLRVPHMDHLTRLVHGTRTRNGHQAEAVT